MDNMNVAFPVALTDAEIDAVAGGAHGGLVDVDIDRTLNNNTVDIRVIRDVDVRNTQVGINVGGIQRGGPQQA